MPFCSLDHLARERVRSGSIFIWEEGATKIMRWTDGKAWSTSRMSGHFQIYKGLARKPQSPQSDDNQDLRLFPDIPVHALAAQAGSDALAASSSTLLPQASSSSSASSASLAPMQPLAEQPLEQRPTKRAQASANHTRSLYKKIATVRTTSGLVYRMVCYYTIQDFQQHKLKLPLNDPRLAALTIPMEEYILDDDAGVPGRRTEPGRRPSLYKSGGGSSSSEEGAPSSEGDRFDYAGGAVTEDGDAPVDVARGGSLGGSAVESEQRLLLLRRRPSVGYRDDTPMHDTVRTRDARADAEPRSKYAHGQGEGRRRKRDDQEQQEEQVQQQQQERVQRQRRRSRSYSPSHHTPHPFPFSLAASSELERPQRRDDGPATPTAASSQAASAGRSDHHLRHRDYNTRPLRQQHGHRPSPGVTQQEQYYRGGEPCEPLLPDRDIYRGGPFPPMLPLQQPAVPADYPSTSARRPYPEWGKAYHPHYQQQQAYSHAQEQAPPPPSGWSPYAPPLPQHRYGPPGWQEQWQTTWSHVRPVRPPPPPPLPPSPSSATPGAGGSGPQARAVQPYVFLTAVDGDEEAGPPHFDSASAATAALPPMQSRASAPVHSLLSPTEDTHDFDSDDEHAPGGARLSPVVAQPDDTQPSRRQT
ncbi:Gluconate transport-inducing protein [Sorochytrium milnesiophthora]